VPTAKEQLDLLKQRVAAIELRFAQRNFSPALWPQQIDVEPARMRVEEWAAGVVVENRFGEHFQIERLFPAHRQHGAADIGSLAELPADMLDVLAEGAIPSVECQRLAFLDTETTGLLGSSNPYAFLAGVGQITAEGFRLRQFFLREYSEEASMLAALADHLSNFDVLITYNGKTFDEPLLDARYQHRGQRSPFDRLAHLDLLHGARRLWKLRLESCRLMELEEQVLGFEREGDLPGELIPYVYFEYVRWQEARRLVPIFHHNAIDILTLACLTAIVPAAFRQTDCDALARLGVKRGEDLCGIGRWLIRAGETERGLELLKRAVDAGLPDRLLFRTLWDMARLEKKLGCAQAAQELFGELAACRNEYRLCALEEIAKYYEHEEGNFAKALEFTAQALACRPGEAWTRRKARLEKKLTKRMKKVNQTRQAKAPAPVK